MNWKEELEAYLESTFPDFLGTEQEVHVKRGAEWAKGWLLSNLPETDFINCVDEERARFSKIANETFWSRIGVDRVVFEDILIMYDQMAERLRQLSLLDIKQIEK